MYNFCYKSGTYVGRIHEIRPSGKAVIEVSAVLQHPKQGDLHSRGSDEISIFHQRKALAHREKALVPMPFIRAYEGEQVPDYNESLRAALQAEIDRCRSLGDDEYAVQALMHLQELEQDYFGTTTS